MGKKREETGERGLLFPVFSPLSFTRIAVLTVFVAWLPITSIMMTCREGGKGGFDRRLGSLQQFTVTLAELNDSMRHSFGERGEGGTPYNGLYGGFRPKGVPFSRFRYMKG